MPSWEREARQKMSDRLAEWLPDHLLHLVLTRQPFIDPGTGRELTDPAFEQLLAENPQAAQQQLMREFLADREATVARLQQLDAERQAGIRDVRSFVKAKRRSKGKARNTQQSIPLP